MQRALLTNDTTVRYVAENGVVEDAVPVRRRHHVVGARGLDPPVGASSSPGYTRRGRHRSSGAASQRPAGRLGDARDVRRSAIFFFALMLGPARPFRARSRRRPGSTGPGPNELLQNHILMAFHPPMLYLGYVGFTVPFAFAIAALATGRVGEGWLVETRRWTLFACGFLTAGIVLGAWWSYEVLGWGGYWAWDPVENASFLPWLTATAYIHSVMVQERRGMLRVWNLTLVCATFSLTILGTFLTRSGVVESVHAFSNSAIGRWLLGFFGLDRRGVGRADRLAGRPAPVAGPDRLAALARGRVLRQQPAVRRVRVRRACWAPCSRSSSRRCDNDRISVGEPFFDRMTMPIGLVLLFLMGDRAGAAVAPRRTPRRMSPAAVVAGVDRRRHARASRRRWAPAASGRCSRSRSAGSPAASAVRQLVLATRRQGWRGLVGRANGGMVVHLGVIVIAVALAASQSLRARGRVRPRPGETARVGRPHADLRRAAAWSSARQPPRAPRPDPGRRRRGASSRASTSTSRTGQEIGTPSVDTRRSAATSTCRCSAGPSEDDPTHRPARDRAAAGRSGCGSAALVMVVGTALAAFPGRRRNPLSPSTVVSRHRRRVPPQAATTTSPPPTSRRGGRHMSDDADGPGRDAVPSVVAPVSRW